MKGNNTSPIGWQEVSLGDVASVSLSSVDKHMRPEEREVYLCNYMDVYNRDRIDSCVDLSRGTVSESEYEKFRIRKGDVFLTKDSETPDDIGRSSFATQDMEDVVCGYHLAILRSDNKNLIGPFLKRIFDLPRIQGRLGGMANGATRFGLTKPTIENLQISIPSLGAQKRIVGILETWDQALFLLTKKIKLKTKNVEAISEKLLNGKIRLDGFASKWVTVRLGDVATINENSLSSSTDSAYSFRYIDLASVDRGYCELPNGHITFANAPSRARRIVERGDILMSTVRPNLLGHCIVEIDAKDIIVSTGFAVIRGKERHLNNRFMFLHLFSKRFNYILKNMLTGSSYPAINSSAVGDLIFDLPPYDEQVAIASILSTANDEIRILKRKLRILSDQRKYLLGNLMTGLIPVPEHLTEATYV